MLRTAAVALLTLFVALPVTGSYPPDFCARVEVGPMPGADPAGKARGGVLSAREVEDLYLKVLLLDDISGDHVLELRLRTPRGHHYQTLTTPISSAPSQPGGRRKVPGYPRPLPVQVLERVPAPEGELLSATLRLPVAGTAIVTASLYGVWTVDVVLDGTGMSCEVLNSFVLVE